MEFLAVNREVLALVVSALGWIAGGISALVVLAWRISAKAQKTLDRMNELDNTARDHEKRIRKLERNSNIIYFPER